MDHVRFKFLRQLFNDERIMGAFVDANAASDAEAFRDVGFACMGIQDDALLPVADRRAIRVAFIVALLGLTIVLPQDSNTHAFTRSLGHGVTL